MHWTRGTGFAAVLAAIVANGAAPVTAAQSGVDFKNFTYANNPCGPNATAMHNGQAEYPDKDPRVDPGTVFALGMTAVYRGRIGKRDAAVVLLYCETHPGENQNADVYAIDGAHATFLRHVAYCSSGSGSWQPDQWIHVRFAGDQLFVDTRTNPDMFPDRWTVTTYRLTGNTLRAVYEADHKRAG